MTTDARCVLCDSFDNIQDGHGKGGLNDVCLGCFYIWYDGDIPRGERILGEDIRAYAIRAKVDITWPFDGRQLPLPDDAERQRLMPEYVAAVNRLTSR